jgi:protein-S-isoprenylcysteine O-methyltransferase Ste14
VAARRTRGFVVSRRQFLVICVDLLVIGALLFVPAGTLRWPAGWTFLGLMCGVTVVVVGMLVRNDPDLLRERMSSPIQRNQPLWDRVMLSAILVLFVLWFVLMPLDAVRFGWSDVPVWLQVVGAVGIVLSYYGMYLTLRENACLYPVVKLQEERGQTVVTTDPYRYVRHPLYAFSLVYFAATALLLGSWFGLLFSTLLMALIILRTALEE